jgi:hypothetical protein
MALIPSSGTRPLFYSSIYGGDDDDDNNKGK